MNQSHGDDDDQGPGQWEVRPGGMLVQKRDPDEDVAHLGPLLRIKVSYGHSAHHISIKAHATFGELKKALVADTGLQPEQQRVLYKGKERKDRDALSEAGVKDKSKLVLVEDKVGWEKKLLELRKEEAMAKARKSVAQVQALVDKVSGQVVSAESAIESGKKVSESEIAGLCDLLMCQLVKLDESKVEGEAKVQKKILTRRVQKYVETLDRLKVQNEKLAAEKARAGAASSVRTRPAGGNRGAAPESASVKPPLGPGLGARRTSANELSSRPPMMTIPEARRASTGNLNSVKPAVPVSSEPLLIQWD